MFRTMTLVGLMMATVVGLAFIGSLSALAQPAPKPQPEVVPAPVPTPDPAASPARETYDSLDAGQDAHAMSERVNPPDQPEYLRYSIRMHKDSVSHYSDNVDLVAFIKLKTFVSEEKRASTSGQRIITCYPNPAHISKNRYGITKDLDFAEGVNPFEAII